MIMKKNIRLFNTDLRLYTCASRTGYFLKPVSKHTNYIDKLHVVGGFKDSYERNSFFKSKLGFEVTGEYPEVDSIVKLEQLIYLLKEYDKKYKIKNKSMFNIF